MKTKTTQYLLTLLVVFSFNEITFAQPGFSPKIDSIINLCTNPTLSKLNRELSGDTSTLISGIPYTILSRNSSSPHNPKAAQFILERFQSYGLQARYMEYRTNGTNVLAVKTGVKYPNRQYIICAHYDDMPSGALAPGADDNASGTCTVMEAARLLAPFNFDYTLIFIAFDEEEQGLIGSHAYADSAFNNGDSILGVLNLDMITWDGNNDYAFSLYSNSNSLTFSNYTKNVFKIYQPVVVPTVIVSNMTSSDHASFWGKGYVALCGIESFNDFNPYYHTIDDNFANVHMPYFLANTRASIAALMTFGLDYFMNIAHTPVTAAPAQTFVIITAVITSPHTISKSSNGPRVYYKVNGGAFNSIIYDYNNLDTFKFTIPGQTEGASVSYYIAAQDSLGNFTATLPSGGKGINPPGTVAPGLLFTYTVSPIGITSNTEPVKFELGQNYPNPFNPSTSISFSVIKSTDVKIVISDMLGREIIELAKGRYNAGTYNVKFEANSLSSGIYYYTMFIDGSPFDSKKMILIK